MRRGTSTRLCDVNSSDCLSSVSLQACSPCKIIQYPPSSFANVCTCVSASFIKCDRKRPTCSRCAQLGISGNCTGNRTKEDEGTRLMNRIAELEGVIRELKNKPRPTQDRSSPALSTGSNSGWPSPSIGYSNSSGQGLHFPSGMGNYPSAAGYSRPSDSLASLMAAYADLADHMFVRRGGNCGCLSEASCYNAVLELSLRLRKAADVLARYSLLDAPGYDPSLASGFSRGPGSGRINSPNSPSMFSQNSPSIFEQPSYADNSGYTGDPDNFMSWVPHTRNT
ncbi:hypothetical protein B0H14DRAFT_2883603 [Mycena olivaceomarginata]|nr:hypothetical protein B0H14DRAFT_2883603 [Mycena olivaceomarginata]